MRNLIVLLGVPVDNLDFNETIDQIDKFVQKGRNLRRSYQVATVNTDFLVKAAGDPKLLRLLQSVDLATPDGMPLLWATRLLGSPLKERVAGADLVPAIAERAARSGYSIYFLGAGPGVAQKAAQILQEKYPGLKVAGVNSPAFTPVRDMDPSVLEEIRTAQPDILLVALGNPKQEKWIELHRHTVRAPVMMGVGGSLDLIAGNLKRAPVWMQKTGLEWLFRLLQEPRRLWRRYGIDLIVFSNRFARQWRGVGRRNRGDQQMVSELTLVNNRALLHIQGEIAVQNLEKLKELSCEALALNSKIVVNLSGVSHIDSAGAGVLVNLANRARETGGNMFLEDVPPRIHSILSSIGLDAFFCILSETDPQPDAKYMIT